MPSFVGTNGVDVRTGADRPFIFGFDGNDSLTLNQTFTGFAYTVSIFGGDGNDTIGVTNTGGATSVAFLDGGDGNDTLNGTNFADGFRDADGNDTVNGGGGTDTAYLGYGFGPTVSFTAFGTASNLTLIGPGGPDHYNDVESFVFSDGVIRTAAQVLALGTPAPDELPASIATTGTISTTQPRFGDINASGDQDWYSANLFAGVQYTILLYGVSSRDTLLRLFDSAGVLLTENDDGAGSRNSLLTFTPATDQSVFLSAGGFATNTGTYELAIFANPTTSPFDAGNNFVALTESGGNWDAQAGDDVVVGSNLADRILGGDGFDGLYGGAGDDFLHGGANEDIVAGDAGNDVLEGGDGGDILSELAAGANSGNDLLYGGNGVDIMYSGDGDDHVDGGVFGDSANNFANLGLGNDFYRGSPGTDTVVAGDGDDFLEGLAGDDSLFGENGNDFIRGGGGIDLLSGSFGNDELFGGAGNDLLVGDEGNDVLDGGSGIDVLFGGAGDDILRGGGSPSADALYGGAGNDTFQLAGTEGGTEYLWDFSAGDRLVFETGHFSQVAAGAVEGHGLLDNYVFASGNSTINVFTASANPGDATVTYTQTGTVVLVGVDLATIAPSFIDINGIF